MNKVLLHSSCMGVNDEMQGKLNYILNNTYIQSIKCFMFDEQLNICCL